MYYMVPVFVWCPCMAINVGVQYNGGPLHDIILLTQCYDHSGTRLNAITKFCICSLWSHLNVLTFFPHDWGMLRRSRCAQFFLSTIYLYDILYTVYILKKKYSTREPFTAASYILFSAARQLKLPSRMVLLYLILHAVRQPITLPDQDVKKLGRVLCSVERLTLYISIMYQVINSMFYLRFV